jgi:2,3-bisphosphoglycerate-independent phosphoglycerate mutase
MSAKIDKKVLLMILDGWGIGDHAKDDAIFQAQPEYINALTEKFPHAQLLTSGENVGLPDGQMGNSEVGHLNIGAGRVVYQDLVKINRAARDGSIAKIPEVAKAFTYAREKGVGVHFMGLVSDGGVHSSLEHLFALCDIAKAYGVENKTFIHCFMDGRDTDPKSGKGYIEALEAHLQTSGGTIATVIGRYYAMDRDKRWERVKIAYDALVSGVGTHVDVGSTGSAASAGSFAAAVQASYNEGVTDEFIKPIVAVNAEGQAIGTIAPNDMVIFFNFRNDRAKELTEVLTQRDMPEAGMHTIPLYYNTMTPYDATFKGLHILFDKDNVENPLGEYLSSLGLKQLRIAETEKYAHVTFFLNGGREATFDGEERILVPSPKVATYDLQPEMSAPEVASKLVDAIKTGRFDFIALNFANGDMVGHTGVYDAITQAVKTVDRCAGQVIDAARTAGYEVIVIADHGNADYALNPDGSPNTAHSLNPVPIIVVSDRVAAVQNGVLADVAPTVLRLMGLSQPSEMTGHSLVRFS